MAEQQGAITIGDSCERNIIEGHVERAAYLFHIVEGDPRRAVASQIGDGAGQRRCCGRRKRLAASSIAPSAASVATLVTAAEVCHMPLTQSRGSRLGFGS